MLEIYDAPVEQHALCVGWICQSHVSWRPVRPPLHQKCFANAGVSVVMLEEAAAASGKASATHAVQRSPVCLLVKNLPYSATEEDLTELFGAMGPLSRLVLPATRTLALVEFAEPQDARRYCWRPYRDARDKPAWRDRTCATHT